VKHIFGVQIKFSVKQKITVAYLPKRMEENEREKIQHNHDDDNDKTSTTITTCNTANIITFTLPSSFNNYIHTHGIT